ncbi:hypothetical protein FRB94_000435 [Tulasnella sp. JGI-2019a]|nr:hypothetical protein FRB94_000435 [Tulasnella sp. JGI-2019a]KAG8999386.1 hypothetical protein FRB93_013265 [Tulasnella sp. JGI-2019a]
MRFSTIFVAIVAASVASAASLHFKRQGAWPACTNGCFPTGPVGNCQLTDNACLCTSGTYVQSTNACFTNNCSGSDLATATGMAQSICQSNGVTMTSVPGGIQIAGPTSTQTVSI